MPRLAGRIPNGMVFLVLSFVPVLVIAAVATEATATLMLAVWTVVLAATATWAYPRDEGRRFS